MNETTGEVRVFVWGSGGAGQLGLGNADDFALPQELPVHKYEIVAKTIATGGCHSTGLDPEGVLYMWGDNEKLQLGRSRDVPSLQVPEQSALTSSTTQADRVHLIACGWSHTIAVTTNAGDGEKPIHQVWSWGAHDHHQLGRDVTIAFPAGAPHPLPFSPLATGRCVISVACGWKHSLLVLDDGSVFSWGAGRHRELGLGREGHTTKTPVHVAPLDGCRIDKVYCGWQHSTFHSSSTGTVYACGNNRHGQLGVPKITEPSRFEPAPVLMSSGLREPLQASQVSVGWHFTLTLGKDGNLYSWGKGAHGQLGQGSYEHAETPINVPFDESVSAIGCGSEHSMVVTQSGELYTSGWGEHGNLGHGDTENKSRLTQVAFFVDENLHVESVAAGGAVSIALVRSRAS